VSSLGNNGFCGGSVERDLGDDAEVTAGSGKVLEGEADRPVSLRMNDENDKPER